MFSAIFGNFLFSSSTTTSAVVRSEEELNEAVQTSKYSEASTQTSNQLVENNSDNNNNNEQTHSTEANTSQQLDWVIVDKTETECMDSGEEPKENLVDMDNGGGAEVAATQEDVLLGSFFDKNATCEDEERYKCYKHLDNNDAELSNEPADAEDTEEPSSQCIDMPNTDNLNKTAKVLEPVKSETWLITPLPCLTSITELSQQRSMIDNDPLENLLIEHPSMSIFMSATAPPTSITASTTTTTTTHNNNNTPLAISKRRNRKPISAHKSKFMQSVIINFE